MKSLENHFTRNSRNNFLQGARTAIPLMLGYAPAGFAFGILAREAGISAAETAFMSLFVYAGSAQFIAIAQIAMGAPLVLIIATCGIVNLRYLLMSASIAKKFSRLPFLPKLLFGVGLTDETFVLHSSRAEAATPEEMAGAGKRAETFGINLSAHMTWFGTSTFGNLFGSMLGDVNRFGVDFALAAVFLALLAPRLRDKRQAGVAIFAGTFSIVFFLLGLGTWSVISATVLAASAGLLLS